ncbi:WG repeat-containing protein [Olivibacter sitiensis]|uniref:WG repeat-containing protein n=1 Tax=Olivibacter sitiensis TaxID=376470 RepID=UPI0004851FD9|nr:WG repeat-containing protein [Olivibacter sitiensis]
MKMLTSYFSYRQHILFLVSIALFSIVFTARGQSKNGTKAWIIEYQMDMRPATNGMSESDSSAMAMMELAQAMMGADSGKTILKAYATPDHQRIEQAGLADYTQITHWADSSSYIIYPASQSAYRVPIASPAIQSELQGDSLITMSSDDGQLVLDGQTKQIAGISCKKATLRFQAGDAQQDLVIWYAPALPKLVWGEYNYLDRIPGMALGIGTLTNGMEIGIQAKTVKEELVDDSLFTVPEEWLTDENADFEDAGEDDYALAPGYQWTDNGTLWGVSDDEGKELIPPTYTDTYGFFAGLAAVSIADKFGVINKQGKEIIPVEYDGIFVAAEDRIWAQIGDRYALIDTTNRKLTKALFEEESLFTYDLAFALKDGKYGFLNKDGTTVIPFQYDEAEMFMADKAKVRVGTRSFFIDRNGKELK